jgi:hypothetical protein
MFDFQELINESNEKDNILFTKINYSYLLDGTLSFNI